MFEFITDEEERGQVGIGTLIVFIAMVLVAAIAAGVLINTAGFLQSKSQETGQQSTKQVSNRLQEVVTVGQVSDNGVTDVNVTVTQAPGAGEIDLSNATINWIGPSGTETLTHKSAGQTDWVFTTTAVKNSDGTTDSTVLNDADDRFNINFNLSTSTGISNGPGLLQEGQSVTIKINTMAGATTTIRFTVPESLGKKDAVEL
ncbi:archaellin/type IV pilin N-terminal domain-containing protein [Halobaculum halobium]|uniref:Flagellin n=1 Tax=Halobaculum halobium TaxID=3032281 RepID=A0ABD5TJ06_9EURY|nr:archaellin/type IV pilin N-terminal domain-containing protein [Halobaculum sp. SYNS20]